MPADNIMIKAQAQKKLDCVAPLIADPFPSNSTTRKNPLMTKIAVTFEPIILLSFDI